MATTATERDLRQGRPKAKHCSWFVKSAGTYCHAFPVKGEKYCKQHREYMRRWIKKQNPDVRYNTPTLRGYSKYD